MDVSLLRMPSPYFKSEEKAACGCMNMIQYKDVLNMIDMYVNGMYTQGQIMPLTEEAK